MAELLQFQRDQERVREARREAKYLRDLHGAATCGLDMRARTIEYGSQSVRPHIARRVADQYLVWAAEYDAIADEIERDLEARLARAPSLTKP